MQRAELPQNLDYVIYFHHYFYPCWIQTDFLMKDIKPWSSFIQATIPPLLSLSLIVQSLLQRASLPSTAFVSMDRHTKRQWDHLEVSSYQVTDCCAVSKIQLGEPARSASVLVNIQHRAAALAAYWLSNRQTITASSHRNIWGVQCRNEGGIQRKSAERPWSTRQL